jgi:(E)-4-hydroxy-3-methylbut-2-enyl-diphosphate synthase
MGCLVNGPGEAREADIAIAGGVGKGALYVKGAFLATVPEAEILARLLEQVKLWKG